MGQNVLFLLGTWLIVIHLPSFLVLLYCNYCGNNIHQPLSSPLLSAYLSLLGVVKGPVLREECVFRELFPIRKLSSLEYLMDSSHTWTFFHWVNIENIRKHFTFKNIFIVVVQKYVDGSKETQLDSIRECLLYYPTEPEPKIGKKRNLTSMTKLFCNKSWRPGGCDL